LLNKVARYTDCEDAPHEAVIASEPEPDSNLLEPDSSLNEEVLEDLFSLIDSRQKQRHLLKSFETNGIERLAQLQQYASKGQTGAFLDSIHTLKGSAATLGIQVIVSRCIAIEKERDQITNERMMQQTEGLKHALQQGCSALHAYLKKNTRHTDS